MEYITSPPTDTYGELAVVSYHTGIPLRYVEDGHHTVLCLPRVGDRGRVQAGILAIGVAVKTISKHPTRAMS